jgi:hypothetical protein
MRSCACADGWKQSVGDSVVVGKDPRGRKLPGCLQHITENQRVLPFAADEQLVSPDDTEVNFPSPFSVDFLPNALDHPLQAIRILLSQGVHLLPCCVAYGTWGPGTLALQWKTWEDWGE